VAFCLSWIWWVTFIVSIVGLVLFQIPWCCRQKEGVQYGSATTAGVMALCHLGVAIYLLIVFSDKTWCEPFTSVAFKDWRPENDWCREEVWATIAFVCAALWAGACGCLFHFVRSGRHAKCEKKYSGGSSNSVEEVELEAVGATKAAAAGPVVTDAAVLVSEPVGNNKVNDIRRSFGLDLFPYQQKGWQTLGSYSNFGSSYCWRNWKESCSPRICSRILTTIVLVLLPFSKEARAALSRRST